MKRTVVTAILSIIIGLGAGWLIFMPGTEGGKSGERKILYYRDPMNPQNTSASPKKAPDGMDFVPVYAEESGGSGERTIAYYEDPMHPWFTSDKPGKAPDCGMDLVPVYEGESGTKGIKIDPVTVQNMGVRVEDVKIRHLNKIIRTVGKVEYDETKVYSINTKVMGWVEQLMVDYTGKLVRKGEPLLDLYSPELVSTQEEYLQALRYDKQMAGSSMDEARKGSDNLVQSARRRLLYWDIPESEIRVLEERGTPKKTMTLYSPVDGYVMDKMVFKGQSVMAGMELFRIADLSTVWIIADIYQYELPWVKLAQKVDVALSYLPGKKLHGTVSYIYPMLSMETKTAKVRVELRNTPALEIRPEMFATVEIASPVTVNTVAVPEQAIIHSGERNIAVMALGGGYFDPREVTLGVTADGYVQILEGVKEGEKIVVSSQFLIDSESNLKAVISQMSGHTEHDTSTSMEATTPAGGEHDMKNMPAENTSEAQKAAEKNDDRPGNEALQAQKVVDPVCGMVISPDEGLAYTYKDTRYYFCSEYDMVKFKENPEKYAMPTKQR